MEFRKNHSYTDKDGIQTQNFYSTKVKLVKSGSMVELYKFGRDIFLGHKPSRIKTKEDLEAEVEAKKEMEKKAKEEGLTLEEYIAQEKAKTKPSPEDLLRFSAQRAKRQIKRLIYANSFKWFKGDGKAYKPITLTLTFKENITNLKSANYEFTKFIRRLNYETNRIEGKELRQSNLKYLAVFELQQRGAIHYHMIFFNLPYIENIYTKLYDIWGQGRIMVGGQKRKFEKIKTRNHLKKIIDYFIKYIQKSIFEKQFPNQKKYIASKDLLKPIVSYFEDVIYLVEEKLPEQDLVFKHEGSKDYAENNVSLSYIKWVDYFQYNLAKNPEAEAEVDFMLDTYC
ncbi:MAG: hypothetical protein WC564_00050 [Patescibacteria group bacterium]